MKEEDYITPAKAIFKDKEILVARPEGMSYEEYKFLRTTQNKVIKKLFAKDPMYKVRRPRIKSKKRG